MKKVALQAVVQLLSVLFGLLKPEHLKELVDKILDWVEDKVEDSANKIDDALVLPLCATIRKAFDIPDDDE